MAKKPRKSRKATELDAFVSTSVDAKLYEKIEEVARGAQYKHAFFDGVIRAYIYAWSEGKIPRAYIGASNPKSRTMYVRPATQKYLKRMSEIDGVSMSTIIRTAFAWYLASFTDNADPWGTDAILLNERSALNLEDDIERPE